MASSIGFVKNYTGILDEVYQRTVVSHCLNSGGRMVRAGCNAKEILIPRISVTSLGNYTRNMDYKTGGITYEYETHSFGYNRAIRLFADVLDVEGNGVLDCFVEACGAAAHTGGAQGRRLHVQLDRGHDGRHRQVGGPLRGRCGRRSGGASRRVQRGGRKADLHREPHPLHHLDAARRACRLLASGLGEVEPRAGAVQPHRGGDAGALLHGHQS